MTGTNAARAPERASTLVTEAETQTIARRFLALFPFLCDVRDGIYHPNMSDSLAVPGEEEFDRFLDRVGTVWKMRATDPLGDYLYLDRAVVADGLREIFYDPQKTYGEKMVMQWLVTPTAEREVSGLADWEVSRICQRALFGGYPFGKIREEDFR